MKRNKHNNVVSNVQGATTHSEKIAADVESTELIMKTADGKLVKAEGVKLTPEFAKLAQKLIKEKGLSKESAEALSKSTVIWTPDMIGKDIDADEPVQKEIKKKKTVRKKTPKAKKEKVTKEPKEKKPAKKTTTSRKKKETSETK